MHVGGAKLLVSAVAWTGTDHGGSPRTRDKRAMERASLGAGLAGGLDPPGSPRRRAASRRRHDRDDPASPSVSPGTLRVRKFDVRFPPAARRGLHTNMGRGSTTARCANAPRFTGPYEKEGSLPPAALGCSKGRARGNGTPDAPPRTFLARSALTSSAPSNGRWLGATAICGSRRAGVRGESTTGSGKSLAPRRFRCGAGNDGCAATRWGFHIPQRRGRVRLRVPPVLPVRRREEGRG